jgi:hypothetical protein
MLKRNMWGREEDVLLLKRNNTSIQQRSFLYWRERLLPKDITNQYQGNVKLKGHEIASQRYVFCL